MGLDAKSLKLFGGRCRAGWIAATVKVSGDRQAGLGLVEGMKRRIFW